MSAESSRKRGGSDSSDASMEKAPHTSFDGSVSGLHDVIVNVRDKKFYCVKLTLARHSMVFHRMFVLNSPEKYKNEVTIDDKVTPEAFELFLHMVNGFGEITDNRVENLLQTLDQLEASAVKSRCETFLLEKSGMTPREKFQIAERNDFEKLKIRIIEQITNLKTYNDVLSDDNIDDLSSASKSLIIKQFKTTLLAHEKSKDDVVVVYDSRNDQNSRRSNHMWCPLQFGQGIQAPGMFPASQPLIGNWASRGGFNYMAFPSAHPPAGPSFVNARIQQSLSQFQGPMNHQPPATSLNVLGSNSRRDQ